MATIQLSYEGRCEGGPWDGQRIYAEMSVVRYDHLDGAYRWVSGSRWLWKPNTPASINNEQTQEVKK